MLDWIDSALTHLQQDKVMLGVVLILVYCIGTVITMIGGVVREGLAERRYRKRERVAEYETERIRHGWDEEDSDEWAAINEEYHEHQQRHRALADTWRERLPRPAHMTPAHVGVRFVPPVVPRAPQWPTWSTEELTLVGRHRYDPSMVLDAMPVSPGQSYTPAQLRALVTQTGQFPAVEVKELVGVGRQ